MIRWLPPQLALIRKAETAGMIYFECRRQFGKTTTFAGIALKKMMQRPGRLVTFASASLNVGKELIYKQENLLSSGISELRTAQAQGGVQQDSKALHAAMGTFQDEARKAGLELTLADRVKDKSYAEIDVDGIADLFERSRLEMRLRHSQTVYSRTQIIAPNPATARGFSGDVLIDEIGFIPDFAEVWEAMEPIASRDPTFRVLMASTPPDDEGHLCYSIGKPPEGTVFEPDANGHWYRSEAGVLCLRVDVWDGEKAGVKLYDLDTKEPITPEEHRARSLNKDGWDRNYALKRIPGGLVAMPGTAIDAAQIKGAESCVARDFGTVQSAATLAPGRFSAEEQAVLDEVQSLTANVAELGLWGVGRDLATTTKAKSNPSALTLMHAKGAERWAKLVLRWKTANPYFDQELTVVAIRTLKRASGQVAELDVDASNERHYATKLKSEITECPVQLIISGELVETGNPIQPTMRQKEKLGSQLVNLATDRLLALPAVKWLKDDFLLVKKEKGMFVAELDTAGNHADTFDSTKLAANALERGEAVEAVFPQRGDLPLSANADKSLPSWMRDRHYDSSETLTLG